MGDGSGRGKLTGLQRAFIDAWFGEAKFNGMEAARLAGYSGGPDPKKEREVWAAQGSRTLAYVNVQEEINRRWASHGMGPGEVVGRLVAMARGDVADFVKAETGAIDWEAVQQRGTIVKKVKHQKGRQSEIELYDAQRALELVGKTMGLFRDRVEHSGPDGGPIAVEDARSAILRRLSEKPTGTGTGTADQGPE